MKSSNLEKEEERKRIGRRSSGLYVHILYTEDNRRVFQCGLVFKIKGKKEESSGRSSRGLGKREIQPTCRAP